MEKKSVKFIAVIIMLFFFMDVCAKKGVIAWADSLLRYRYYHANIDTNYLGRPDGMWNVRLGTNVSSTEIEMKSLEDGINYGMELKTDVKATAQVKVSYIGLSLSLSLNPASLSGRETDWGLNISSSGRRMGFDVTLSKSRTMKGTLYEVETNSELSINFMQQRMFYASAYYAFNSRRFAYAAPFSQSYIQKRSAGSWLLSASVYDTSFKGDESVINNTRLHYFDLAVGGGYGYNWVPVSKWLFHLSFIPSLCFYSYCSATLDDSYDKMEMNFPEFILQGKAAIQYQSGRWYVGSNMVFNTILAGNKNAVELTHTRWYARAFVGFRF